DSLPALGDDRRERAAPVAPMRDAGEENASLERDARARGLLQRSLPDDPLELQRAGGEPARGIRGEGTEPDESVSVHHQLEVTNEPQVEDEARSPGVSFRPMLEDDRPELELELLRRRDVRIGLIEGTVGEDPRGPEDDERRREDRRPEHHHRAASST